MLYLGDEGVPGAADALQRLEVAGMRILFVTNNSSRPRRAVADKICRLSGYPAQPEQVLNSAQATALLLAEERPQCLVVGGDGIGEALAVRGIAVTTDWQSAEAVVVGFDPQATYAKLRDASLAVQAGARLVATNLDATFPTSAGLWPGAGALVAALETATGRTAEAAGKPHAPMRALVREHLGPGAVWVVGDRADTDLAMGKAEGWATVLALSGVVRHQDEVPPELKPDVVVNSLRELPAALGL